jgi:hypothetical protein
MLTVLRCLALCATCAHAFTLPATTPRRADLTAARSPAARLAEAAADESYVRQNVVTRSREAGTERSGALVVTEGTGELYQSRAIFDVLHDVGRYASISVLSASAASARKSLLSRTARYSGLVDVLKFFEGAQEDALVAAMSGADAWLALNADEASFPIQLAAAKRAGVARVFALFTSGGPTSALGDAGALEAALAESGLVYTVMRTGTLVDAGVGGGLILDAVDVPVCDDVPREDVFRFVSEALSLEAAEGRLFSLCPSSRTGDALREMRRAGYERREEVEALLKGLVVEAPDPEAAPAEATPEEAAAAAESAAEAEAKREAEVKELLERARQRGVATQARLKFEAEEAEAHRKEQEKYYSAPQDPVVPDAPPPLDDSKPDPNNESPKE